MFHSHHEGKYRYLSKFQWTSWTLMIRVKGRGEDTFECIWLVMPIGKKKGNIDEDDQSASSTTLKLEYCRVNCVVREVLYRYGTQLTWTTLLLFGSRRGIRFGRIGRCRLRFRLFHFDHDRLRSWNYEHERIMGYISYKEEDSISLPSMDLISLLSSSYRSQFSPLQSVTLVPSISSIPPSFLLQHLKWK